MFRDRWETFDIVSAGIVLAVPLFALIHPRLTLSRNLAFSGLVLAACYVLLPRIVFGSAYADMRLVPFAAAIFILADPLQGGDALPAGDLAGARRGRVHAGPAGRDDRQHGDRRQATRRSS